MNSSCVTIGASPSDGSSSSTQLRPAHQRAGDGEHLLLAAAHAPRLLAAPVGEPRETSSTSARCRRRRHDRVARYAPSRRFSSTVRSASVPRPCGTCAMPARATFSGLRAQRSSGRRTGTTPARVDHARQRAQRRRLARAVCAEDDDHFAFVDGEVDAVQHLHRPVPRAQLRDLEQAVTQAVPRYASMTSGLVRMSSGSAFGDLAAEVEHHDVFGDRHHHCHVVLDEQHRERVLVADLAHEGRELVDLGVREPGGGLVEAQQARARGERAGDLDPLQRAVRQTDRRLRRRTRSSDSRSRISSASRRRALAWTRRASGRRPSRSR